MVGAFYFGESFTTPDSAGTRSFTFVNNNAFSANIMVTFASVSALAEKFIGGVTFKWLGSNVSFSVAEATASISSPAGQLDNTISANGSDTLLVTFGDPIQRTGGPTAGKPPRSKTASWNITLSSDVAPVPLPAGGLLLVGALGGLAALRRRKSV